jgi:hypothetical protein
LLRFNVFHALWLRKRTEGFRDFTRLHEHLVAEFTGTIPMVAAAAVEP